MVYGRPHYDPQAQPSGGSYLSSYGTGDAHVGQGVGDQRASGTATAFNNFMTPVEERFANDDLNDARELAYRVNELERQIHGLEEVNAELEHRLERQAREKLRSEQAAQEALAAKDEELLAKEQERKAWERRYEAEVQSSAHVTDRLRRAEKELQRIVMRKYEMQRGGPGVGPGPGALGDPQTRRSALASAQGSAAPQRAMSPEAAGKKAETASNVFQGLLRFLGAAPDVSKPGDQPPQSVAPPDGRAQPGIGGGGGGLNQGGLNPNAILMGSLGTVGRGSMGDGGMSRATYVRQRNAAESLVQFLGL